MRPWLDRILQDTGPLELYDAHTHIGQNDPDGYKQTPAELLEALAPVDARARAVPDARARRLPGGERRGDRGGRRAPRRARRLLPRQPARPRGPRGAARARRRRGRDQAAPARGAVRDGRAGRRRAGRARARAPPADADPRRPRDPGARAEHGPARRALPGRDADPRPRRDLRPRLAVEGAARPSQRPDRHLVVEPRRPRRAVRARAAELDRVGERLALRPPDRGHRDDAALRAAGRADARPGPRRGRRHAGAPDRGRARRTTSGRRPASPTARSTCCWSASWST